MFWFRFQLGKFFFSGVFYEQESIRVLGYASAMETYIHVVPYMFYAIVAVLIVPMFALGIIT